MDFLARAGYRPDAMVTFMEKLMAEEQRRGGGHPFPLLSSHPATQERLMRLQYLVEQYPLLMRQENPVYEERYQEVVLRRLK
jgi:predicted Zn-dependent protease